MEENIPYEDKVHFYANPKLKKLIYTKRDYLGKGWIAIKVGRYKLKTRADAKSEVRRLLSEKYPEYKDVSLFTSLSYHSPQNKRITNYSGGQEKWALQYSKLNKIGTYKLDEPVRTSKKRTFGKPVSKVPLYEWDYTAINWFGGNENLELKRTLKSPFEDEPEKLLFTTGQVPRTRANELIKKLKRMAGKK